MDNPRVVKSEATKDSAPWACLDQYYLSGQSRSPSIISAKATKDPTVKNFVCPQILLKGERDERLKDLHKILRPDGHNRISLVGQDGAGKTHLLHHITREYHDLWPHRFDCVLRLDLKHLNDTSYWEGKYDAYIDDYPTACLVHHSFPRSLRRKITLDQIINVLKDGGKEVLLVADGYDYIGKNVNDPDSIASMVLNDLSSFNNVIFSSRYGVPDLTHKFPTRMEILGFDRQGLSKFMDNVLGNEYQSKQHIDMVMSNSAVQSTYSNPLYAQLFCFLLKDSIEKKNDPEDFKKVAGSINGAKLYSKVVSNLIKGDQDARSKVLECLKIVAYTTLKREKKESPHSLNDLPLNEEESLFVVNGKDLKYALKETNTPLEGVKNCGLLRFESDSKTIENDATFPFLHPRFCRYLAALQMGDILNGGRDETQDSLIEFLQHHRYDSNSLTLMRFLAGIVSDRYIATPKEMKQQKKDAEQTVKLFWKIVCCDVDNVVGLGLKQRTTLFMHLVPQTDPLVLNIVKEAGLDVCGFIDRVIIKFHSNFIEELKASGYVSKQVVSLFLKAIKIEGTKDDALSVLSKVSGHELVIPHVTTLYNSALGWLGEYSSISQVTTALQSIMSMISSGANVDTGRFFAQLQIIITRNKSAIVKTYVCDMLSQILDQCPDSLKTIHDMIRELLKDSDATVKAFAAKELHEIASKMNLEDVLKTLPSLLTDRSVKVKLSAVNILITIAENADPSTILYLIKHICTTASLQNEDLLSAMQKSFLHREHQVKLDIGKIPDDVSKLNPNGKIPVSPNGPRKGSPKTQNIKLMLDNTTSPLLQSQDEKLKNFGAFILMSHKDQVDDALYKKLHKQYLTQLEADQNFVIPQKLKDYNSSSKTTSNCSKPLLSQKKHSSESAFLLVAPQLNTTIAAIKSFCLSDDTNELDKALIILEKKSAILIKETFKSLHNLFSELVNNKIPKKFSILATFLSHRDNFSKIEESSPFFDIVALNMRNMINIKVSERRASQTSRSASVEARDLKYVKNLAKHVFDNFESFTGKGSEVMGCIKSLYKVVLTICSRDSEGVDGIDDTYVSFIMQCVECGFAPEFRYKDSCRGEIIFEGVCYLIHDVSVFQKLMKCTIEYQAAGSNTANRHLKFETAFPLEKNDVIQRSAATIPTYSLANPEHPMTHEETLCSFVRMSSEKKGETFILFEWRDFFGYINTILIRSGDRSDKTPCKIDERRTHPDKIDIAFREKIFGYSDHTAEYSVFCVAVKEKIKRDILELSRYEKSYKYSLFNLFTYHVSSLSEIKPIKCHSDKLLCLENGDLRGFQEKIATEERINILVERVDKMSSVMNNIEKLNSFELSLQESKIHKDPDAVLKINTIRMLMNICYMSSALILDGRIKIELSNKQKSWIGWVGEMIKKIGEKAPDVAKIGLVLIGEIFAAWDKYRQEEAFKRYASAVPDAVEMAKLAEILATVMVICHKNGKLHLNEMNIKGNHTKIKELILVGADGALNGGGVTEVLSVIEEGVREDVAERTAEKIDDSLSKYQVSGIVSMFKKIFGINPTKNPDDIRKLHNIEEGKKIAKYLINLVFKGYVETGGVLTPEQIAQNIVKYLVQHQILDRDCLGEIGKLIGVDFKGEKTFKTFFKMSLNTMDLAEKVLLMVQKKALGQHPHSSKWQPQLEDALVNSLYNAIKKEERLKALNEKKLDKFLEPLSTKVYRELNIVKTKEHKDGWFSNKTKSWVCKITQKTQNETYFKECDGGSCATEYLQNCLNKYVNSAFDEYADSDVC